MTPQEFIVKWGPGGPAAALNERQGAQAHFMDLCQLLGVPTPGSTDDYVFEKDTQVLGEGRGYADVSKLGHFAWENKAPGKDLDKALKQLLNYSLALSNPPLLVVCDRNIIRIHTRFTGHPTDTHTVLLGEMDDPKKLTLLRRIWLDPESFKPKVTTRDITEIAARSFATLADSLRKQGPKRETDGLGWQEHADLVAHFLTQCLFCFFAQDVNLLPDRLFDRLIHDKKLTSERLTQVMSQLFVAMGRGGNFGLEVVPWFNGGLFKTVNVPQLSILEVAELREAARLNWSSIDVSIFGTLFERGLDPSKRSQLGAHYTDPATIGRIIEPVVVRPLLHIWEQTKQAIQAEMSLNRKRNDKHHQAAQKHFAQWLDQLQKYRVLDPACGSGNFLFLGLKALKDVEHRSHIEAVTLGLDRQADLVTGPHNLLGIEINEYAAELARVTVWIGELQWRINHGYEFKIHPILEPLDTIERRDALLHWEAGLPVEAQWPWASVVIGNPPFLGGSKKRGDLGSGYFDALSSVFTGRVPAGADLVCYWFDKAREQIKHHGLGAAGLVATQAIRAGSNRQVLEAIAADTVIFDAWADEAWVNDGAAVRVSIVNFGWGGCCFLNGERVQGITAELGSGANTDTTRAKRLAENADVSFEGTKKYGDFDVPGELARAWLGQPNPHGRSNAEVLRPWRNGSDLTKRPSGTWIVDFGSRPRLDDVALFEAPFTHLTVKVQPGRIKAKLPDAWWLHERPRPAMRTALAPLSRYIATPRVAKHRFFVFLDACVLPDTRLNAIARADDTTFGILTSRIHEAWSLANVSMHGDGNTPTYNAKSCFETFPFPPGLTPADTVSQQTELLEGGACIPSDLADKNTSSRLSNTALSATEIEVKTTTKPTRSKPAKQNAAPESSGPLTVRQAAVAIAQAAKQLNDYRENWLNPAEWTQRVPEVVPHGMTTSPYPERIVARAGFEKQLEARTLTKLYNQRPAWLTMAHHALDVAVAAAYGWTDYSAETSDDEILKRLLALNLERAAA